MTDWDESGQLYAIRDAVRRGTKHLIPPTGRQDRVYYPQVSFPKRPAPKATTLTRIQRLAVYMHLLQTKTVSLLQMKQRTGYTNKQLEPLFKRWIELGIVYLSPYTRGYEALKKSLPSEDQ